MLHDLNLAARVADQLVLLDKGRLVASGPCEEVLHPDLLSEVYRVNVERITHNGRIHLLFNPPQQ